MSKQLYLCRWNRKLHLHLPTRLGWVAVCYSAIMFVYYIYSIGVYKFYVVADAMLILTSVHLNHAKTVEPVMIYQVDLLVFVLKSLLGLSALRQYYSRVLNSRADLVQHA